MGERACIDCGGPTCGIPRVQRCAACSRRRIAHLAAERQAEVDPVSVDRLVGGSPPATATYAEVRQAVDALTRRGMSAALIASIVGRSERAVVRHRARARSAA